MAGLIVQNCICKQTVANRLSLRKILRCFGVLCTHWHLTNGNLEVSSYKLLASCNLQAVRVQKREETCWKEKKLVEKIPLSERFFHPFEVTLSAGSSHPLVYHTRAPLELLSENSSLNLLNIWIALNSALYKVKRATAYSPWVPAFSLFGIASLAKSEHQILVVLAICFRCHHFGSFSFRFLSLWHSSHFDSYLFDPCHLISILISSYLISFDSYHPFSSYPASYQNFSNGFHWNFRFPYALPSLAYLAR